MISKETVTFSVFFIRVSFFFSHSHIYSLLLDAKELVNGKKEFSEQRVLEKAFRIVGITEWSNEILD